METNQENVWDTVEPKRHIIGRECMCKHCMEYEARDMAPRDCLPCEYHNLNNKYCYCGECIEPGLCHCDHCISVTNAMHYWYPHCIAEALAEPFINKDGAYYYATWASSDVYGKARSLGHENQYIWQKALELEPNGHIRMYLKKHCEPGQVRARIAPTAAWLRVTARALVDEASRRLVEASS
jgi:hypothetical protein